MQSTSKTIALRDALQNLLNSLTENVYYEEASVSRHYPYIVFELSELGFSDERTLIQMEVNAFDYGKSSSTVEMISDEIQEALDQYYFINDYIQFCIYKDSRQIIKEMDKKIIRRRMLFEIHLHERKGV